MLPIDERMLSSGTGCGTSRSSPCCVQAVLAGPHRGATATLVSIEEDMFQARIRLHIDGKPEVAAEYEDICKLRS